MKTYTVELVKSGNRYHQITRNSLSQEIVSMGWTCGVLAQTENLKNVIFKDQMKPLVKE